MKMLKRLGVAILTITMAFQGMATAPPEETATIFVHGFNVTGTSNTGPVGEDYNLGYAMDFAAVANLPTAFSDPLAANQVAATTYYGDTYPPYYTQQDIDDVEAATAAFGGGVPRYAHIVAKYARHVMERSGATQVSLVGVSFGALVSRYIIEKDLEGLASSKSIARWVGVEGVVAGNHAATYGGIWADVFFDQYFDGAPVDLDHMTYTWVNDNLNDPYYSSSAEWFADFPVHFWLGADDDLFNKFVTELSGKANDGLVLMEDGVLRNLPADLLYEGLTPTQSVLHANHETLKTNAGFQLGLAAQLFGRTRVTITLSEVEVLREFDGGALGDGEYVFGIQVSSPLAETFEITSPIQDLRAEDNSLPYALLKVGTRYTINQVWYDDIILPGETQLKLVTNVHEIDGDRIYQIEEVSGEVHQALQNAQMFVDVTRNGSYPIATDDWRGTVEVSIHEYTPFGGPPTAASDWTLYE